MTLPLIRDLTTQRVYKCFPSQENLSPKTLSHKITSFDFQSFYLLKLIQKSEKWSFIYERSYHVKLSSWHDWGFVLSTNRVLSSNCTTILCYRATIFQMDCSKTKTQIVSQFQIKCHILANSSIPILRQISTNNTCF